ncbi:hypothetical protein MYSTI_07322 [Myxococcus stipitatus DSM 14675]|uniref:Tetratricopeptide repeat protein n=1 Tax=Myxococcus stipitatus (strain DSM 14675 / JCM 12634 / Mx s8) TaxID=1278073 RepID=L7UPV9_MYXSD|nr:hypothetical protein MYSTI_07322 [Myxococcus stipitatus DSM 14675]
MGGAAVVFVDSFLRGWGTLFLVSLLVCGLLLGLRRLFPKGAGLFPRLAAVPWPYLPLGVLMAGAWVGVALLLAWAIAMLWREQLLLWERGVSSLPGLGILGWLWPSLPLVVGVVSVLALAARFLSRRVFHLAVATVALSTALGLSAQWECTLSGNQPAMGWAGCGFNHVTGRYFTDNVISPLVEQTSTPAKLVTLLLVGGGVLVLLMVFERSNLRQSLRPIRVGGIWDVSGVRHPALEQLVRECIHRNAPHAPTPLPGGPLTYWQDFVEQDTVKDDRWWSRVAAFVLRLMKPPSELEVSGNILFSEAEGLHGIRVNMVDVYSGQTLMARTFWDAEKVEHAVERAAYCAAERALEICTTLPEWSYWREGDGLALREYHEGVREMRKGAKGHGGRAEECFREAATQSPGSAPARLQLAQALEAQGNYVEAIGIYLELAERFPHLGIVRFRLASACRSACKWAPRLSEARPVLDERCPDAWKCLRDSLENQRILPLDRIQDVDLARLWVTRDALGLEYVMLLLARESLQRLLTAMRWRILGWCVRQTSDRRFFWRTFFWPPRKRWTQVLTVETALACVELRLSQVRLLDVSSFWSELMLRPLSLRRLTRWQDMQRGIERFQPSLSRKERRELRLGVLGEEWVLGERWAARAYLQEQARFTDLRRRIGRISAEATAASRETQAQWWGGLSYTLACFYSLCRVLGPQLRTGARPSSVPRDLVEDTTEEDGRRAVLHLSLSLRDPEGLFSRGTWNWLLSYPDLEPLKEHDGFENWKRVLMGEKAPMARPSATPGAPSPA